MDDSISYQLIVWGEEVTLTGVNFDELEARFRRLCMRRGHAIKVQHWVDWYEFVSDYEHIETVAGTYIVARDDDLCCICLNREHYTIWLQTPCLHRMHARCIRTWNQTAVSCPMCRLAF